MYFIFFRKSYPKKIWIIKNNTYLCSIEAMVLRLKLKTMKNETLTQQTNFEFIRWYSEGDIIQFKNGDEWIITKIKPKAEKLLIKPYNYIAKERYISIEIETTFDELLPRIENIINNN